MVALALALAGLTPPVGPAAAARAARSARATSTSTERDPRDRPSRADLDADGADDDPEGAGEATGADIEHAGAGAAARGGSSATYTIRAGDTLWNVSQSMRGRGGWPKLWAMNPKITNPHWIYPGQVVRLREGEGLVEDPDDPEDAPSSGNPAASVSISAEPRPLVGLTGGNRRAAAPATDVVPVRQLAFVDEGSLKSAGSISGSVEEKIMLATGDQAYVEFPAGKMPAVGTRFSIYDVDGDNPLRSPENDAVIGRLAHVFGEVVIDQVTDRRIASGHLVGLSGPVERGYRVGPVVPQVRAVAPRPNRAQVTGRIVAAVDPTSFIANQMFVIVDRGRRHGIEVGNRFLVLRQGDGLKRILEGWDANDPRFPPYAVAEIVAVDVGNETTVGWISRGSRELRVGDVADLRRGY